MVIQLSYLGSANRMANMATCKRPKRTIAHTNHANSRSNSRCSRVCVLIAYEFGDRSAATRPTAIRMRTGERMADRRISMSTASWQGLQRAHLWRGSGASIGSLSVMGSNKMKCVQIEQRKGLYLLCPASRLVVSVSSFPGNIMLFVCCPFRWTTGYQQERDHFLFALLCAFKYDNCNTFFVTFL